MCVLLLEDEALIRRILAAVLEESGYQVCEAACLSDAQECLDGGGTLVIIADHDLGNDEDGHHFARDARSRHPHLAVIYTSGLHDRLGGGGLRDREWVLPKPYLPSRVADMVRHALAA